MIHADLCREGAINLWLCALEDACQLWGCWRWQPGSEPWCKPTRVPEGSPRYTPLPHPKGRVSSPLSHKALNLSVSSHTSQGEGWNQTQFDERLNHHLEKYFSLTSHLLLEPVSIKPNSIPKGQFCACSEEAQGWDSPEQEASSGPAVGTLHTRFLPILSSASSPAAIAG